MKNKFLLPGLLAASIWRLLAAPPGTTMGSER